MSFETGGKNLSVYLGPGCWYTLHLMAANASTDLEKNAVIVLINLYKKHFFCEKCRLHFIEFINLDPPENHINNDEGLFLWTWRCHNNANKLIGKNLMSYDNAKNLYFNTKPCTSACGTNEIHNEIKEEHEKNEKYELVFLSKNNTKKNKIKYLPAF